jgi:hypothetical protein
MEWVALSALWVAGVPFGSQPVAAMSPAGRPAMKSADAASAGPYAVTFTDAATDHAGQGRWPRAASHYGAGVAADAVWPRAASHYGQNTGAEGHVSAVALGATPTAWPRAVSHYGQNTGADRSAAAARPASPYGLYSFMDGPPARGAVPAAGSFGLYSYMEGPATGARPGATPTGPEFSYMDGPPSRRVVPVAAGPEFSYLDGPQAAAPLPSPRSSRPSR